MSPKSSSSSRTSSSKSSSRPNLMRASATAPSLATSNASRQDYSNLQSSRATALLTRVASYSQSQHGYTHHHSHSASSSLCSSPDRDAGKERYEGYGTSNYFSFPSFEDFQEYEHREKRIP